MYIRELSSELLDASKDYPVVTLLGPRQSGKTTLVKEIFPDKPYVNLEVPDIREIAILDPNAFLAKYPEGAILDEIQKAPSLLSYIQDIVDRKNTKGMFILTGSHQLELNQAISQSLAGRTAILKLMPLSIDELPRSESLDEYLYNGFFPRIHKDKLNPTKAYSSYVQTYVERDVRQLVNVKDLSIFQRFLRLSASRVGQILNIHSLSNDLGVSSHTVKNWLSILEASFLVVMLQPYFENFGKRLIKSPKLFFTDVGLVSYLLGIENQQQISRDPLRGNLVENLVLMELIKGRLNNGLDPLFYFYRDSHGNEVDVIYKKANQLIPIEIKAAQTVTQDFFKGLNYFQELVGDRCQKGYLIYAGEYEQKIKSFEVINFHNTERILKVE